MARAVLVPAAPLVNPARQPCPPRIAFRKLEGRRCRRRYAPCSVRGQQPQAAPYEGGSSNGAGSGERGPGAQALANSVPFSQWGAARPDPAPQPSSSGSGTTTVREAMAESLQQLKASVAALQAQATGSLVSVDDSLGDQPPEIGLPLGADAGAGLDARRRMAAVEPPVPPAPTSASAATAGVATAYASAAALPLPGTAGREDESIKDSWDSLMRWSRMFKSRQASKLAAKDLDKVVVFGGGSFGTAMGVSLARQHPNTKDFNLPPNITATTSAPEAVLGAQCAIHAVPVQHSRAFLEGIKDLIHPKLPVVSVSKGVEVSTGHLMSDLIPSVLGKKHPTAYLSGPSFAKEVMDDRPTGVTVASRDKNLTRTVQTLFASPSMRVSTSTDVVGVEVCGALKNVLAIAAGIVEGMGLGHNAMAALVVQGCTEIRWLADKMGAKAATISGLSGLGDIMLTCYGSLSRNRSVGVRLGKGEKLEDILASSTQARACVAEGVATAGVVVSLARKYHVQLPVLTAVAQVVNGHLSAREAVREIMMLPQTEER
eukprot:scaffold6.g2500.t1